MIIVPASPLIKALGSPLSIALASSLNIALASSLIIALPKDMIVSPTCELTATQYHTGHMPAAVANGDIMESSIKALFQEIMCYKTGDSILFSLFMFSSL